MRSIAVPVFAMALSACAGPALPPAYLEVADHELCTGEEEQGEMTAVCLPLEQPADCPTSSWEDLNALEGDDVLGDCS